MLSDNIKRLRSAAGLSQEELAEKLQELNSSLAEQIEKNRRLRRALSIAILAAACVGLLIQLLPRLHGFFTGLYLSRAAGSIIGGADGPTAIYVGSSGPNWPVLVIFSTLLILGILGLFKTRKR